MSNLSPFDAPFRRVLLELEGCVLLPAASNPTTAVAREERKARERSAVTFQANVEGLGFGFPRADFDRLRDLPTDLQASLYAASWPVLCELVGADRHWSPMYPNFPKQVIQAADAELFVNALLHYMGDIVGFRFLPDYPMEKRPKLRGGKSKLRPLRLGRPEDGLAILKRWLGSTVAWSPSQAAAVRTGLDWALGETRGRDGWGQALQAIRQAPCPNRENKAVVVAWWLKTVSGVHSAVTNSTTHSDWPFDPMSPVDVLRAAVAASDGDVSLAKPTRFKSLPRSQRRALIGALDRGIPVTATAEEDVFNRREAFLRLGERLHPGEFASAHPLAAALFDAVRNQKAPVSLMGRLDAALTRPPTAASLATVGALFAERPGALARQLHRVLRWTQKPAQAQEIVQAFTATADQCATGLLLTVAHHFDHQTARKKRAVLPKGSLARICLTESVPSAVDPNLASSVVAAAESALKRRFARLPALGPCHVDPALDQIPTPFAVRSASKALHTLPRGSKLSLDAKTGIIRLFLWWSESDPKGQMANVDRIDIDLSCVVMDREFRVVSTCSYWDLRGSGLTHSGDITSAPHGACEFVDIDRARLPKSARYVVMSINSYTEQPYADVPECFAGWMERKDADSGEAFEPRTVANRFDLTAESTGVVPMLLDLQHNQAVWLDMPYGEQEAHCVNNVLTQESKLRRTVEGFQHLSRPTLGRLFRLHAQARGELVKRPQDAQTLFTLAPQHDKAGVNAYMLETIAGEWMAEASHEEPVPLVQPRTSAPKRSRR